MTWLLPGIGTVLCVGIFLTANEPQQAPAPRLVDVAALVRQLGSDDFQEREDATRRLSTLPVNEVPPELLAALNSDNPEVRARATKAWRALREHIALIHLPRGERFAKRGQIDLYVASTAVISYKEDDPRLWEPALDVGRVAIKKADMTKGRLPQGCPALCQTVAEYKKAVNPWFARLDEPYTKHWQGWGGIQAPGSSSPGGFCYHTLVSRGTVNTPGSQMSLLLIAGDLVSEDDISCSAIICDGDVQVGGNVLKSLVIARGSISIKGIADSSTFIAGKTVVIAKPSNRVRRVSNDPDQQNEHDKDWHNFRVITEEHKTIPLGYITFFELSTVGVEAKMVDRVVQVTGLAADKPFAEAGVKVGDIVAEVNGKKPDSPESLRRLLRDALAIGDATVKLQRGGKTEIVKVSLPE